VSTRADRGPRRRPPTADRGAGASAHLIPRLTTRLHPRRLNLRPMSSKRVSPELSSKALIGANCRSQPRNEGPASSLHSLPSRAIYPGLRPACRRGTQGCGCSSGVEHHVANVRVEGSNPFARSNPVSPAICKTVPEFDGRVRAGHALRQSAPISRSPSLGRVRRARPRSHRVRPEFRACADPGPARDAEPWPAYPTASPGSRPCGRCRAPGARCR
jgi:hypothetical protein